MDHSRRATFYRTALLLGLIRGDAVHQWAERVIANADKPPAAFIDLIAVPVDDLSEMRHALWPLVVDPPPLDVLHAVLGLIHDDLAQRRRGLADTLTILRQMRSLLKLPASIYSDLNDALVEHSKQPDGHVIPGWLPKFATRPFHLRDATDADVPALANLHVQTFNETHRDGRGGGPSYELRERQWREAFSVTDGSWFCVVVEDDAGRLVGFAKGTPHDGAVPGFAGELNKIYVLRRCHRQGVGQLLLYSVARRFVDRGVTSMLLFGDAASPSNGFYERFGAERIYAESGEFHGGYGWRDLRSLVAICGA